MGKFISNFSTTAELTAFSATTGFGRPHVSLTKDDGQLHFFEVPCESQIVKTTYEMVDLGLPSGVKWANKNIGALTVTDYGQKFAWGETNGFTNDQVSGTCHSKAFSWTDYKYNPSGDGSTMTKYNSSDGKTVLDLSDDAARANIGGSWRMPTETEFNELVSNTTSAWTSSYEGSGVVGLVLTSKNDSSKKLFFPAAGLCRYGSVYGVDSYGSYWSSSLDTSNVVYGRFLYLSSGGCHMGYNSRRDGFAVRGVVGNS